jgi:hypothetical protein
VRVQDTYKQEPIILNMPGATVRVFVPEISDEENARRMRLIHDAAAELLRTKGVR